MQTDAKADERTDRHSAFACRHMNGRERGQTDGRADGQSVFACRHTNGRERGQTDGQSTFACRQPAASTSRSHTSIHSSSPA
eukprot:355027-Chlamydomonas_euryale.AAC.9